MLLIQVLILGFVNNLIFTTQRISINRDEKKGYKNFIS